MQRGFSVVFIIVITTLMLVSGAYFAYAQNFQNIRQINSYDDCAKAGYPVLLSYPGQCNTPDGQHFIQELSEEEKKKTMPPDYVENNLLDGNCAEIDNAKVDSQLIQLYSFEDPQEFASSSEIYFVDGIVRVVIETNGEVDLSKVEGFVEEVESLGLIQGLIEIKKLCELSNIENVKFIRLPTRPISL